jgi:hypothetical protein
VPWNPASLTVTVCAAAAPVDVNASDDSLSEIFELEGVGEDDGFADAVAVGIDDGVDDGIADGAAEGGVDRCAGGDTPMNAPPAPPPHAASVIAAAAPMRKVSVDFMFAW